MPDSDFYTCGNCKNYRKCRSNDNPIKPSDKACDEYDFKPKNAIKRAIYPNEKAQELDSSITLFVRPISDKKCEWWVDYGLDKLHVATKEVKADFWKSTPMLQRMAKTIAQREGGAAPSLSSHSCNSLRWTSTKKS